MTNHTTERVHLFFLGTKEEIELFLFMCSHHVPTLFPMMSFKLPMMFLKFPVCSPRVFPIANHFIPCPLPKVLHFVTYTGLWKGEALHPHIEIAILGSLPSFFFLVWWCTNQNSPLQKEKRKLGSNPFNE